MLTQVFLLMHYREELELQELYERFQKPTQVEH